LIGRCVCANMMRSLLVKGVFLQSRVIPHGKLTNKVFLVFASMACRLIGAITVYIRLPMCYH